jgi:leucyl/phenylalanyl-tRNA--protein transferase
MAEPKSPTASGQPGGGASTGDRRETPDAAGRGREPPAVGEIRIEEGVEADLEWPDGLVAVGGDLSPEMLIRAYRSGVFPWSSDPAVTWWSPDPRAIFDLQGFRANRSLRKSIRRSGWTFTTDRDFGAVMRACAEPTPDRPSTWISAEFVSAYTELNRRGLAHSLEVWEGRPARDQGDQGDRGDQGDQGEMIGGLYGVTLGGFFGGESMFRRRTDASKAAVAFLVEHLRARGFALLDAQVPTPHLESLGAIKISRAEYLRRLRRALVLPVTF